MDSRLSHATPLEMEETRLAMPSPDGMPPPLTEPDCTTRHTTSSNRSLTGDSKNATAALSPRQISLRTTPPSGRLLAPTQASAAKATPPPCLKYRKPLPSARPSSISKLPRRDASAPVATTSVSKWAARVAQREADNNASNQYLRENLPLVASSGQRTVSSNKPLPPRPVVSLASAASPSKDGRTLMDASERPMRLSGVSTRDGWPSLTPSVTPRSFSAPERDSRSLSTDTKPSPSGIPRRTSGNTFTVAAVSSLTTSAHERDVSHSRSSGLTGRSSIPSFVSAEESVGGDAHSESASVVDASPRYDASSRPDASTSTSTSHNNHDPVPYRGNANFPLRSHSLAKFSSLSDLTPEIGDHPAVPAISDDAKDIYAPAYEGRKQGASAANFSRLRGAIQPHRTSLSSLHTSGTDRTASRIPIPGSKKATLVHVQTQNLESDPDENSPTFGTRHLISPRALAILDQGTKRRLDLRRANTNNSDASDQSQLVSHTLRDLRTRRHSRSSSPSYTTGVSDSDSDELITPISQPSLPRSGTMAKLTPGDPNTDTYEPVSSSPLDRPRLRRVPPSKSRLTRPLETIPSQSMLIADQPEVVTATKGRFSKVAKQLSQAQAKNTHAKQGDTLRDASRDELREMLTATQTEDDARQKDGVPGFDIETKNHLTRTLSQLEGQGTPPSDFIDYDKLHAMFAHVGPRLSAAPKTNTFIDNATAANMFLERGSVSSEQVKPVHLEDHNRHPVEPYQKGLAVGTANSTPVISKWSDSTPSALGESTERPCSTLPSSIVFPFATPSATHIPSSTADSFFTEKEAGESAVATRNSSPTLGSGKLYQQKSIGSVRRARENMNERGGFARMTRASLSKKIARNPTSASKGLRKPRGRDSNSTSTGIKSPQSLATRGTLEERIGRTLATSSTSNEPRSHSRSRTLLNKMAGVFSLKRGEKSQQFSVPPLPPLNLERHTGHTTLDGQIDNGKPFQSGPTPPLPEVRSLRRSTLKESQPSSRATNATDQPLSSVLELDNNHAINNVLTLTEKLLSKAKLHTSPEQRQRLLNFALVLNDGLKSAREAGISAETARHMAEAAELSYGKTREAVRMLERLAGSLVKGTPPH